MDFKEATDKLMGSVSFQDLAEALGVSISLVRQARSKTTALCYRKPPKGWEHVVLRLAKQRTEHFTKLVETLGPVALAVDPVQKTATHAAGHDSQRGGPTKNKLQSNDE
jgi:hypothetical protein